MKSIVTIGESVVNLVCSGEGASLENARSFEKMPGGAPANVAAAVSRLGGSAQMIARVGRDSFGDFLVEDLKESGVNTELVRRTDKANTPVAFIAYDESGKRDFVIYHEYGAERFITPDMIREEVFKGCAVLYFGSLGLCGEAPRKAHKKAIGYARKNGALIAFDPNLRPIRGISSAELRTNISQFLPLTDIIKLSENELSKISGTQSREKSFRLLLAFGCRCIIMTKNSGGAELILNDGRRISLRGEGEFPLAAGSGDRFFGAFLFELAKKGVTRSELARLSDEEYSELLHFAFEYAAKRTGE